MNELGDLRHAMQDPPGYTPRELDLDAIMQTGGRLRRRRRLAVGTAAAAAVVVLLVGGSQLIGGNDRSSGGTAVAPAAAAAPTTPAPSPSPTSSSATSIGAVIRTGIKTEGGEWVLYGVTIDDPQLRGIPFGLMLGVRKPGGSIEPAVETNETAGHTALSAGFHAGEGSMNAAGRDTLTFGYYAGKQPYRISGVVGHKVVKAHKQVWSKDSTVTVYWFGLDQVGPGQSVTGLTAYDAKGNKLPLGDASFGVG